MLIAFIYNLNKWSLLKCSDVFDPREEASLKDKNLTWTEENTDNSQVYHQPYRVWAKRCYLFFLINAICCHINFFPEHFSVCWQPRGHFHLYENKAADKQ